MSVVTKNSQNRTCVDCGAKFIGNPRARYCPECRQLRRGGTTFEEEKQNQPGFFSRIANFFEPIKGYLSYTRLMILNVICIAIGIGAVFYLKSLPYSLDVAEKIEAVGPSNMALIILLFVGTALRVLHWRKINGTDEADAGYWRNNYWKQLLAWLIGIIFVEASSMIFFFA